MNERHYGVATLGWLPTHSFEIESYSANGGHPPNDILEETKVFPFFSLEEKTNVYLMHNTNDVFVQIVNPGN